MAFHLYRARPGESGIALRAGNLDEVLGNHLAAYRAQPPGAWQEIRPGYWRDEFGVVWNRTVDRDIGVVEDYQLKTRSLAGYTFPDPHDPQAIRQVAGLSRPPIRTVFAT